MTTPPSSIAKFIWHFIKQQKYKFLLIQFFALAWTLDNTAWPYAFKLLIDDMLAFNNEKALIWTYIWPVLLFWGSLWITIEIMFRLQGILMAKTFPQFEAAIRMSMFRYVANHSYYFFASHFSGNISNKISDMTQSATRIMQLILMLFVPALLAMLIAGIMFYFIQPLFAVLLLGWVALHLGICFFSANRCCELSDKHSTSRSFLTGKIVDTFTNIINVKLFSRQKFEVDYLSDFQRDEKEKHYQSVIYVEKIKIVLGISSLIFPGLLLTWYEIYCWQNNLINMGDVVFIFNTNWNIIMITWYAGMELPNLYKEIGICQQALTVIKAKHDITDKQGATPLKVSQGKIKFNNVTFHYHHKTKLFNQLNVTIEPGTKVGLVGFSGSGKTSFVHLIMRFFEIEGGEIEIDNQNIKNVTLISLRQQISMIPQDPSLFHRTLMENIRYGKIEASDEEVFTAAKHAHCHEFIQNLSEGYHTLVGERGIKLSGGQRQRIAIARAILKNAPLLILDEATSALDSVTEKHIQEALHFLMKDRTTIVIAHRLSTLSEMDRILVFDQGKIIEDGTHQQLLQNNYHYAQLWHMQAGGFLPESIE